MDLYSKFKFNLKVTIATGLVGGLLFATYDITTTVLRNDFLLPPASLFTFALYPILIYGLLGVLGMSIFGSIIWSLATSGELALNRRRLIAMQVGIFVLLAMSVIVGDASNVFSSPNIVAGWNILLYSALFAIGASLFTYFLVGKYSAGRIALFCASASLSVVFAMLFVTYKNASHAQITDAGYAQIIVNDSDNNTPPVQNSKERPNILWIVMDAARADHFSSYGYYRETTPYIDSLAKEGTLFTNAISPAPWTLPAHASMLTGLFPSKHGADGAWDWLDSNFVTLPEVLSKEGYDTVAFSSSRLFSSRSNTSQGFDTFGEIEIPDPEKDDEGEKKLLLDRAAIRIQEALNIYSRILGFTPVLSITPPQIFAVDAGASGINVRVKKYFKMAQETNKPLFMFIDYGEVHAPYGDSPYKGRYLGEVDTGESQAELRRRFVRLNKFHYISRQKEISEEDVKIINALYDGDLAYLDFKIGELIEYIRGLGILDNTFIVITSDHGENLGERNTVDHLFDLHRTVTHVPLIIRYPKVFPPGTIVERLVQTVDLFPTILDVIGVSDFDQGELQGYNLLDEGRPQFAISEARFKSIPIGVKRIFNRHPELNPDADQRFFGGVWKSIQTHDYEYIQSSRQNYLYNLKEDPQELHNLIESEPQKAEELKRSLQEWLSSFDHYWGIF